MTPDARRSPTQSPLDLFSEPVRNWFLDRFDGPSPAQTRAWPLVSRGENVLVSAPTGSGKTLAAFLAAIDGLAREGSALPDEIRVVYVSPLRALSNDIRTNLIEPLEGIAARTPEGSRAEIRALVRTGDTSPSERRAMLGRPPHILVTTPESLQILLTSASMRERLRTVRTVIVDEIHAMLGDKRAALLALDLERLEHVAGPFQRIGLSATQRPVETVAHFLVGSGRACEIVDEGHARDLDLEIELPTSPLEPVCASEVWEEIYARVVDLIERHRTTLVFVSTRKLAERAAARLEEILGAEVVTCHHSSLSRERRHDAERRLKQGELRALVATASLELGIDIGDVDLVIQLGSTRSIATLIQRVGRSGHGIGRTPRGRLFPLTIDELIESVALVEAVRAGRLDLTAEARGPLDILGQQIVCECAAETWSDEELFHVVKRAWPYRHLDRESWSRLIGLYTKGRRALIHRDETLGALRGTRRARLVALTCSGAIPDRNETRVLLEPDGIVIGSVDEDFAIDATIGDVFRLGNASWRILRLENGTLRVAAAGDSAASLPFWFGEAPARTPELSAEVARIYAKAESSDAWESPGVPRAATEMIIEHLRDARATLGALPSLDRVVAERFFDESGGMQLIIHSLHGARVHRAWGLALRKRFCRKFGFELQAAADENAFLLSLGPHNSFPLEEVFDYLRSASARQVLTQALLATPMFETRWRWNVCRALLVERFRSGKRVPPPLVRMRAQDLLANAFPEVLACGENLPPGDLPVPLDHAIVRQTVDDCLEEPMDIARLLDVLGKLERGEIERVAVDTSEPSLLARSILSARPYAFLDDAPLEERRSQAASARRGRRETSFDAPGELDPAIVELVRDEIWPRPESADEVHEALLWMGYVTAEEAEDWSDLIDELARAGRIVREGDRFFAKEASRDPKDILLGRLEACGPLEGDDPAFLALESAGHIFRVRIGGVVKWCERRVLARIRRLMLDSRRRAFEPVTIGVFLDFLARWQHAHPAYRLEGPAGVRSVIEQLAGFELPAAAWERHVLPLRVEGYDPAWLDQLTLTGEVAWTRLRSGKAAARSMPLALVPGDELYRWRELCSSDEAVELSAPAREVHRALSDRGALRTRDIISITGLPEADVRRGLEELIAAGLLGGDSFALLRDILVRAKASFPIDTPPPPGRWCLLGSVPYDEKPTAEDIARSLLRRWGVVFRRLLVRERQPFSWREICRELRRLELRGEVTGGRFVATVTGEQFALPHAEALLSRAARERTEGASPFRVSAADPLNLSGVLLPGDRVPSTRRSAVVLESSNVF